MKFFTLLQSLFSNPSNHQGTISSFTTDLDMRTRSTRVISSIEHHSDLQRTPAEIIIAIDAGTANVKAATLIRWKCDPPQFRPLLEGGRVWDRVKQVSWGMSTSLPMQAAYSRNHDTEGTEEYRQIWGWDVENALNEGRIRPDQVLKWLKVTMFDDTSDSRSFHKDRLRHRMDRLKKDGILEKDMSVENLWIDLLGNTYRHILNDLRCSYSGLGNYLKVPSGDNASLMAGTAIKVMFAVPANASMKSIDGLIYTATRAGIPNVEVVAEPFAALVAAAQLEVQDRGILPEGVPMIIADIGAGTVDVVPVVLKGEIVSEKDSDPEKFWTVHELAIGEAGWRGMAFVDSAFRTEFESQYDLSSKMDIIRQQNPTLEKDIILDNLQWQFERKKREFSGDRLSYRPLELSFQGLPDLNNGSSLSVNNGIIRLKFEFVQKCFDVVVLPLIRSLARFVGRIGSRGQRVGRIILTGGGSDNEYVRSSIFSAFENTQGYPIYMERDASSASSRTVVGAALVGLNRTVMGHRRVRRGYCFAYDPPMERSKTYPKIAKYFDEAAQEWRLKRVSKFLLSIGDTVSEGSTRYASQKFGAFLQCVYDVENLVFTKTGLVIREWLYYTDVKAACKDLLSIQEELNVHKGRFDIASELLFELPNVIWRRLPFLLDFASPPSLHIHFQYDIGITIERGILRFFLLIPKSGRFESLEAVKSPDPEKIFKVEAVLNCGGIFTDTPNTARQSTFNID